TGIAVDSLGDAFLSGYTTNQLYLPTPPFPPAGTGNSLAVVKLNAGGSSAGYVTVLGAPASHSFGYGIAVGGAGSAYVTRGTDAAAFPVVRPACHPKLLGTSEAAVVRLDASGNTWAATYLGGTSTDQGAAIAVGRDGYPYVTGWTASNNFPTTVGAYQTSSG